MYFKSWNLLDSASQNLIQIAIQSLQKEIEPEFSNKLNRKAFHCDNWIYLLNMLLINYE